MQTGHARGLVWPQRDRADDGSPYTQLGALGGITYAFALAILRHRSLRRPRGGFVRLSRRVRPDM